MSEIISLPAQIGSFKITMSDIKLIDVDKLHALSLSVGWPHRAEDWQFFLDVGKGVALLDQIDRVLATAMWFPHGDNFSTVGMLITSPKLQSLGAGQWLMKLALNDQKGRELGLVSTHQAIRLYRSLAFEPEASVNQCQGIISGSFTSSVLNDDDETRLLTTDDLPALKVLDRAAFGADRSELMLALAERSSSIGLFRRGTLIAFAMCRAFGRGHLVGPVVASDDGDAISVVQQHFSNHTGQHLRIDTRKDTGLFANFLNNSGLAVRATVPTMSLGRSWLKACSNENHPQTFALAAQALG